MTNKATLITNQPRSLYTICCIELFERFSFFGIRSLLVLYLIKHFGFSDGNAFNLYAAIMALMYATSILGGMVADYLTGNVRALMLGSMVLCIGYSFLLWDYQPAFYYGISLVIIGSGLFKPNITSVLGDLYNSNNSQLRDSGFTIFYTVINIGAICAPVLCGYLAITHSWTLSFSLIFISTLLTSSLAVYYYYNSEIRKYRSIQTILFSAKNLVLVMFIILAMMILIEQLLINLNHFKYLMSIIGVIALGLFARVFVNSNKDEKRSLIVLIMLIVFSVFFFALHEQSATSITLFFEHHAKREFLGYTFTTSQLQSFGPAFVLIFGPALAWIWRYLSIKGKEPTEIVKFSFNYIFTSFCFSLLVYAITVYLRSNEQVPMLFIFIFFLFYTLAELCLAPIGLAITTKLAPHKHLSTIVSFWFLAISFGHYLSGYIAQLATVPQKTNLSTEIDIYQQAFLYISIFSLCLGILLLIMNPLLNKFQRIC